MNLTTEDRAAWAEYEAANAAAERMYTLLPSAKPYVSDHFPCVCCEVPTIQPVGVCLSCQTFVREAGR